MQNQSTLLAVGLLLACVPVYLQGGNSKLNTQQFDLNRAGTYQVVVKNYGLVGSLLDNTWQYAVGDTKFTGVRQSNLEELWGDYSGEGIFVGAVTIIPNGQPKVRRVRKFEQFNTQRPGHYTVSLIGTGDGTLQLENKEVCCTRIPSQFNTSKGARAWGTITVHPDLTTTLRPLAGDVR